MRIAVIVKSLQFGGMEKVAVTLATSFQRQGHESHLIYFNETKDKLPIPQSVKVHSFKLKQIMKRSPLGLAWKTISQILNIMIRNSYFIWIGLYMAPIFRKKMATIEDEYGKFDLIIFRGQGTFEMIWPVHDERFVFVNESLLYENNYGFLKKRYARLLFNNRNISSISSGVKNSFKTLQNSANFSVCKHTLITNPIDIEETKKLSYAPIESFSFPYIISVGRFHPIKNFPLLIEAYSYAKEYLGLTHNLVLVGEGRERKKIENTIRKLSLEQNVYLIGYKENPYTYMREADLFVLSSIQEGLGMVLLEAMACDTDIIATDSPGGVKDVMVGQLATHICQSDKISLATKIVEILDNPIKNFSNYLEPYSTTHIVELFIQNFTPKQN
jgi:glycosyltransferase involved in cell wall biosynthesis